MLLAGAKGCNPLTGLFVCDSKPILQSAANCLSCNPLTGLFVCDPLSMKTSNCSTTSKRCNPLTGLFVCDNCLMARFALGALSCNPLTGLFVCDSHLLPAPGWRILAGLQSPYGAFCLRRAQHKRSGPHPQWLQSPYGAFCLRPVKGLWPMSTFPVAIPLRGFLFATRAIQPVRASAPGLLQSPYGAFCLRQHTPLIAVL